VPTPQPYTLRYSDRTHGRPPLATIHHPPGTAVGTAVVVHGGGFVGGWRDMPAVRTVVAGLLDARLAVVCPDYRVLFRGGRFPEALQDVCAAWDFTDAHPDLPAPLHLVGLSAGAALAATLTGTRDPRSAVLIYGPHDFTHLPRWAARALLRSRDPAQIAAASPGHHCTTQAPVLVLHGAQDQLCPLHHSEFLVAQRRAADLPTTYEVLEGSGHGFLTWPERPDSQQVITRIRSWLADVGQ